ncbi:hypothetical protein, partial [Klebsiella pneumoniae]|uniref:hypothetical protein n=3 Tax=Klebsiella/Raoultella group TaxID=2890311 RepID=UPI003A4E4D32
HQLVILNFCFATELPASSGLWSSDPSTQQKFDLFNKALQMNKFELMQKQEKIQRESGTIAICHLMLYRPISFSD